MALRTFRSNPSLGGFGSETTAHDVRHYLRNHTTARDTHDRNNDDDDDDYNTVKDCDAFSQIIKELVDNAVDACCMLSGPQPQPKSKRRRRTTTQKKASPSSPPPPPSSETSMRRVRVLIEPFTPSSSSNASAEASMVGHTSAAAATAVKTKRARDILRVTVSDTGCGMANIQDCVEAFRSSKADNANTTATDDKLSAQQQHMTAGRYGIGLTLCLLHAQRLVPNTSTCITSATATDSHFTCVNCVVDTDRDSVQCVDPTKSPKRTPHESGTAVSLLIPGGLTARLAWPRLANYFSRFGLSLGMSCSLEVRAATLTNMPLYVRPPLEQQQRKRQHHQQQQRLLQETTASQTSGADTVSKGTHDDEETWGGVFDDQEEEEGESNDDSRVESPTQGNTLRNIKDIAVVSPEETTEKKRNGYTQDNDSDSIKDIHRAVEAYIGQPVDPANLACSRQPIRNGNYQASKKRSRCRQTGPSLEVTLVVCGVREELGTSPEEDDSSMIDSNKTDDGDDDDPLVPTAPPTRDATMTIVRMVNRIPLLDGAEANSCGLVQGILQKRRVWNSFGLEVSSTGFQQRRGGLRKDNNGKEEAFHQVPTLQVRDSEQVMPFLRSANHSLLEDPFGDDGSDTDSNDVDVDVEDLYTRKRRRKKGRKWLLPARVRLGDILVIVQIDAKPSQLPLPTLSKGRLPTDNMAIDKALEVAVMECLRSIQKTNPSLWLTAHQLKKAERDAQYVPAVASSLASIISRSTDSDFRESMTTMIRRFGGSGMDNSDNSDEESLGEDNEAESMVSRSSHNSNQSHEVGSREQQGGKTPQTANRDSPQDNPLLIRELGESLEARLRKVVLAHDEPPKKRIPTKRAKVENDDTEGNDSDDNQSHKSESSLVSYDFSAQSEESPARTATTPLTPKPANFESDLESYFDALSDGSPAPPRQLARKESTRDNLGDEEDDDDWLWK